MKHEFHVSPVVPSIRTLGSEEGNAPPAARLNLVSTWSQGASFTASSAKSGMPHIAVIDLFVVPTIGFRLPYVLVIVRLARRELVWINVTARQTAEWIAQQITEAFAWDAVHRSLDKDAPIHRAIAHLGAIASRPVLGGLHHQYCRF
jgi:hypothetical protein